MTLRLAACAAMGCVWCAPVASAYTITTYHTRAAFEAAMARPCDFEEDFEGFLADTEFRTGPVNLNGFSLAQNGNGAFRNEVDVPPTSFTDTNGTAVASMFVEGDSQLSVDLTLAAPGEAWGAHFLLQGPAPSLTEGVSISVSVANGAPTVFNLYSEISNPFVEEFFGVIVTGDTITSINFFATTADGGSIGEGFSMDTVCTYIPGPATAAPLAMLAFAFRRRRAN